MTIRFAPIALAVTLAMTSLAQAQTRPATAPSTAPLAPAVLPGKGLAQHDFFYAGEAKDRRMFIVKNGQVVWSYDDPQGKGEISDAVLMSNGNVVLAHQYGVKVISRDKQVIWNYNAPTGTEIHTAQPIGTDHIVFIQNGAEPFLRVVNIVSNETVKQLPLTVKNPKSVHGQFRHARITPAGTIMVAHMDSSKVCEYNFDGKEIWSFPGEGVWGVEPLKNGDVLITDKLGTRQINRRGDVVWSYAKSDIPEYRALSLQNAWRLPNGNTIVSSWFNQWNGAVNKTNAPIQALELTPEKQVVWALRQWDSPDLGPATTIQILDEPTAPENVTFGPIK